MRDKKQTQTISLDGEEGDRVYGTLKSLKYKASTIPSGGLDVFLLLKFGYQEKWVTHIIKEFLDNFYTYDFAGNLVEDDGNGGENEIDFDTVSVLV